jgi:acetylornithine deacetylase
MRLARSIHFFISYDEEVDADDARRLVEGMLPGWWRPDMCVVGDPTGMAAVVAYKAKLVVRGRAHGLAGHSSQPANGVNAVHA